MFIFRWRRCVSSLFSLCAAIILMTAHTAEAATVTKSTTGTDVVNRETRGAAVQFSTSTKRICLLTTLAGINSGAIRHVWRRNGLQTDDVQLKYAPGRFRTWSCKENLAPGIWGVETYDEKGNLLYQNYFDLLEYLKFVDDRFSGSVSQYCNNLQKTAIDRPTIQFRIWQKPTAKIGVELPRNLSEISDKHGKVLWSDTNETGSPWPPRCDGIPNNYGGREYIFPDVDHTIEKVNVKFVIRACERTVLLDKRFHELVPGARLEHIHGSTFELKEAYVLDYGGGLQIKLSLIQPETSSTTLINNNRFNFYLITADGVSRPVSHSDWYTKDGVDRFNVMAQKYDTDYQKDALVISYDEPKEVQPSIFNVADIPNPRYQGKGCP